MNTVDNRSARAPHRFRIGAAAAALVLLPALSGCGSDSKDSIGDHAVVTFQVQAETFRVELLSKDLVDNALKLLNGEPAPSIPNGVVDRGDPGPNSPWTWHLDPSTIEFADATTEVCDGLPSDVEKGLITSDRYCPWSAKVIDVQAD